MQPLLMSGEYHMIKSNKNEKQQDEILKEEEAQPSQTSEIKNSKDLKDDYEKKVSSVDEPYVLANFNLPADQVSTFAHPLAKKKAHMSQTLLYTYQFTNKKQNLLEMRQRYLE